MPSKTEWRDLEQSIGQDAFKLESARRSGGAGVILGIWLAFYVLAVTHALILQPATAPIATAEALESSQSLPLR
jgi:hypothetical protein